MSILQDISNDYYEHMIYELHSRPSVVENVNKMIHCVFTLLKELRVYFLKDRTLLDCLFHSVRDVVFRMFSKMNKTENFTPGLICVLHTFGRDLKWNAHIHALISEGGADNIMVGKHDYGKVYDSRLSNSSIESLNRKAKDLKRSGRGYRNFEHFRNRFLYATRETLVLNGVTDYNPVLYFDDDDNSTI